ncbi:hypothetical protein F0562_034514 [Nyssa sinensis]|uniref:Uncharacterized protein n=1 Tax=Nyssa sinensis TaxID=561372 RepID=A0A5J5AL13_9ASTE|nr:hypothetical protein F0562_034514 [Nyssa sinensis]
MFNVVEINQSLSLWLHPDDASLSIWLHLDEEIRYMILIPYLGVARVGDSLNFEACMDISYLLYEKEKTSTLYSSPRFLAASILDRRGRSDLLHFH